MKAWALPGALARIGLDGIVNAALVIVAAFV
jgi:hypothetical protein